MPPAATTTASVISRQQWSPAHRDANGQKIAPAPPSPALRLVREPRGGATPAVRTLADRSAVGYRRSSLRVSLTQTHPRWSRPATVAEQNLIPIGSWAAHSCGHTAQVRSGRSAVLGSTRRYVSSVVGMFFDLCLLCPFPAIECSRFLRTGRNGGLEDRYRGRFFCSLARLVKRGPPLLSAAGEPCHRTKSIAVRSRARRDSDGQQRHGGRHHEVPPEPCCVCSPTDRARREFACPGPRVGSLGVAEVRSDITTLLPNLRLMATATGENSLVPARLT